MSDKHHYKVNYFSETDAQTIIKRNQRHEKERGRKILKARAGIVDHLEAKAIGMTVEDYRKWLGVNV